MSRLQARKKPGILLTEVTMANPTLKAVKHRRQTPALRNGQRLSRDEFERRYDAMSELKKAELIEGVVYMPSPVRQKQHGGPHFDLIACMGVYRMYTPGVAGGVSSSIRLDLDNEPQPDGVLFIEPTLGGHAFIDADGYIAGSPELAAEVPASTTRLDLKAKFRVYRRNEIREYLIWRVAKKTLDWYVVRNGRYELLPVSRAGYLQSEVFPGLWLDAKALLTGDLVRVREVLQQGLQSTEHGEFVARLKAAGA
jgi:Uma2 family endonuclease